ncbi:protein of unknown function [Taphrina deformans PYCC 5710]|uniref:Uncharacterized protein n=1 Tax=Taphrina deformans (strain PYCC 5710 / ATCC 11124 / CBS 356.35 / IMI 108563 / JCM 9778 / NBRC 8474) TaxID=1097556 RepID=R4XMK5_TAPDE|nr:protein of unknown function [Taphrina deformans PYCC 5710]|eukprot:CCG84540.1 protein of unknown function [Taphrina deformans PYCC 5710]
MTHLPSSSHATIYHALEDKIQKHRTFGFLRSDTGHGPPVSKYAATPRDALAARLKTRADLLPTPPDTLRLPASDLLDAIHGHTSVLFADRYPHAVRALDESALLFLGIVAEELAADVIGAQGHLLLAGDEQALDSEGQRTNDPEHMYHSHLGDVVEFTYVEEEDSGLANDNGQSPDVASDTPKDKSVVEKQKMQKMKKRKDKAKSRRGTDEGAGKRGRRDQSGEAASTSENGARDDQFASTVESTSRPSNVTPTSVSSMPPREPLAAATRGKQAKRHRVGF